MLHEVRFPHSRDIIGGDGAVYSLYATPPEGKPADQTWSPRA